MIDMTLDLALAFLRAHPTWYIFPITRLEKDPPHITDNLASASNDPKQIRIWHAKWRGCNWGLSLRKSNVLVMDIDTKPGKVGQDTLDDLTMEYGALPDTFTVRSPSGGLHYYFDGVHKFALGKHGFGKDIDSPNYVLIPGCWLCTNSEQGYETINDVPLAPSPEWFGLFLKEKGDKQAADADPAVDLDKPENIARMVRYLQEGAPPSIQGQNGDKALFDVSCVLKDNGISEYKAVELIDQYYNVAGKCEPLWAVGSGPDADRLDVKVHNAYQYARENQAGAATAEFAFGDPGDKLDPGEVETMQEAWRARLKQQTKEKAATRERKLFTEEALIDPLTGEPYDKEPPPGGSKKQKAKDDNKEADDADTTEQDTADAGDDVERDLPWLCRTWVWVAGIERFVRLRDGLMWSRSQFDSVFNHMTTTSSISGAIFKTDGRIRRIERIAFRPGQGVFLDKGRSLNLWRRSLIKPTMGDTNLWNEHLNYLFQNPEDKDHVLNWLAWVYQNPDKKPNHALLIVGKNTGTGKSFIARIMEQLLGKDNTQRPKNSSLKGDFNGWALRCKLCIIEELMQIGRREVANELRDIITEPTIEVNIKNVPAQLVENYMAMMGISNHPDALPLDDTDRRWLVVSTPVYRLDPDYYRRLFKILETPTALAAIAYELQTRELGEYDASQAAPDTDAKREMIQLSRSDTESWLYEHIGNPPFTRNIVAIGDVREFMPNHLNRVPRLDTIIQTFMRDRLRGEVLGQIRVNDGRRLRLWALHGRYSMLKQESQTKLAEIYENERKQGAGARSQEDQAMEDFGD